MYILIDSSNDPIKQNVRKLCMFKPWQCPSSSYPKRGFGPETIFLGGQIEMSIGIFISCTY